MDFVEATDILLAHTRIEELADALGVSVQSIRQARMKKSSKGYRSPPKGWQKAVAAVARIHAKELTTFADRLLKECD